MTQILPCARAWAAGSLLVALMAFGVAAQNAEPEAPEPAPESTPAEVVDEQEATPPADLPEHHATLIAIFDRVERFGKLVVESGSGVITLRGSTTSPTVRDEAAELAAGLEGVVFVDNQIEILVKEPASEKQPDADEPAPTTQDERIENKLRAVVAQVDELSDITVSVEAGVVHLAGETASTAASKRAGDLAAALEGVLFVDNDVRATSDLGKRLLPDITHVIEIGRDLVMNVPLYLVALIAVAFFFWLAQRSRGWQLPQTWFGGRVLLLDQVHQILWLAIVLLGVFVALEILDATAVVGAVLGTAGLVGLAVSFAFRDIIENYLASLLLSVRRPFFAKDTVEVDGTLGKVIRMTTSETLLLTLDGNHVRVPNAQIFKSKIVNYSRNPLRRFEFSVGVGTDIDLGHAQELGLATVKDVPGVLADPPPLALIDALGDSTVAMRFLAWVDQGEADFSKVRSKTIHLVKAVFDAEEIDMPVPTHEVVLRRRSTTAAGAKREEREKKATAKRDAERARIDVQTGDISTDDDIDEQIDRENAVTLETDLLEDEG